jgi:hypothetical protein
MRSWPSSSSLADAEHPLRIRRGVWWLGLAATVLVAVVGSAIAYLEGLPAFVQGVPHLDKACHFGVLGAIAFFLDPITRRRSIRVGQAIHLPVAAILILVPAGVEEYLQRFSANRSSSLGDFIADASGVVFFIWLSRRVDGGGREGGRAGVDAR